MIAADLLAFVAVFFAIRYHRPVPAIVLFSGQRWHGGNVDFFLILALFFVVVRLLMGDYNRRQLFWEGARATTSTLALLALLDFGLALMIPGSSLLIAVISWLAVMVILPIGRQLARHILSAIGVWQIPAAIFGHGDSVADVYHALGNSLALGFDIRYLIQTADNAEPPPELAHLRRIADDDPAALGTKLNETDCAQVIVAMGSAPPPQIGELIQRFIGAGKNVVIIPFLRGLPLFGLQTDYFFGRDMLLLQVRNNLTRFPSRIVKRVTDAVGSLILLVLLSPVFLAIAIAIKLDSRGSVFFVQSRVGRGARPFPCFKFRTMVVGAEAVLETWQREQPHLYDDYIQSNFKLRDDPRVTRVGAWLRRFSLDELPQLLNVLIGQMSLVGPRPLLAREIPDYGPGIDLYCHVHPGITGLWQTRGRSETNFLDRVTYDEWYILNWSYWYDIVILLQTIGIVTAGKGAF